MESVTKIYVLDFGDDTVSASRFFTHPEPRTVQQFEAVPHAAPGHPETMKSAGSDPELATRNPELFETDRLKGAVTPEAIEAEDMEGMEEFAEQLARLKAKGYVEIREVLHCRVTRGITEEY